MRQIKRALLGGLLSAILLITGCSPFVENNTIEEIAPVIFWFIKDGGEGKLNISTLVPPLIKEKKRLLSKNVELLKQGGKEFNLVYYRELKNGQLRMILINEELAKKGILSMIDTLLNDPNISQRLYVAIVDGNFSDYINSQLSQQANLDYFLYRMFKHYEDKHQGEMSIVNLHQFKNKLYTPFSDPILPVFKVDKNNFTYQGTAFFRHDKLIGKINKIDDEILQLINNDHYLKLLPLPELSVSIDHVRGNTYMKLNQDYSSLSFIVHLSGRIDEYRGNKNLHDYEDFLALNHEINAFLKKHTVDLLKKMQEWKVDPLEVGKHTLRPFKKSMSEKEWSNYWSKMNINVEYQIDLDPLKNMNQ
ncbi:MULTISPECIES: Ger(x)C family spore germination protein [unclassified Paenibacillus]|uniref:Ger(x)C family spore germination protein n=1 Tax=unclassified Paenibacillus TaxID=185978 RepID=UPI001AEA31A2|nr:MULTISPECIES: Ger(x)C family spore germination protein [unclassified Paenibacillus]MBP1155646.1 spore germination protein [Paenibacillus sp. PvP091]MBP1168968.1 spore germination protein [Paenibacillus sp. PvR098]MBP2439996.1 spore germination protein [Paenibacillus sp. PvP052]